MTIRRLRFLLVVVLTIFPSLALMRPAFADPPSNDDFASAQTISGSSGTVDGTNNEATEQAGEPDNAGESAPIQSVWYAWTAPKTASFYFQTCDSALDDTTLGAYTGTTVTTLSSVAENDDGCGSFYLRHQSRIVFAATSGTTYHLSVDGWSDTTGGFVLSWGLANDKFGEAEVLSGRIGTANGSNEQFSGEPGEPDNAGVSSPIQSAWYKWTAPRSAPVAFDTCAQSEGDTTLGVYTGSSVSSLTSHGESDDDCLRIGDDSNGSRVVFDAEAGVTYYISVDDVDAIAAPFTLRWQVLNDKFVHAEPISGLSGSISGRNEYFTDEPGEPNNAGASDPIRSAWFSWIAPESGKFAFDTCEEATLDTTLGVYSGSAVNALALLGDNDDEACGTYRYRSRVIFTATQGTTYRISVAGEFGDEGAFTLSWGAAPPVADLSVRKNDSADPVIIGSDVTYAIVVSNAGPDSAHVTMHDTMDSTTTFVSYTASQGSCDVPPVGVSGDVACALGTLPKGADETVTVTVRPTQIADVSDSASVESNAADSTVRDRVDSELTHVRPVSLLQNGGFETDGNKDGRPDKWTSNAKFTRRATQVYSGKFAGRHRATDNSGYAIQQTIPGVTSDTDYHFYGEVKIPSTADTFTFMVQVRWQNKANSILRADTVATYTGSTIDWNQAYARLSPPTGTVKGQVRMVVKSLKATIYVDQFELVKGT